ncbi:MAG: hypothetical protein RL063_1730, partial [Pseudomonadota bacterium]
YMSDIKEEVNREVRFQELQQLQQEIQATVDQTQTVIQHQVSTLNQELDFKETAIPKVVNKKPVARKNMPTKVKSS